MRKILYFNLIISLFILFCKVLCFSEEIPPITTSPTKEGVEEVVSDDYKLGPFDSLQINIWGLVPYRTYFNGEKSLTTEEKQTSYLLTVSCDGKIFLPVVGEIKIADLSIKEAREKLEKEFTKYFKNFKLSIILKNIRDIKIFVLGEVKKPASFIIPYLSKLDKAIDLAGGVNDMGSISDIKIIRGKEEFKIDFYKFLYEGDTTQNIILEAGDIIFVSKAKNIDWKKIYPRYKEIYVLGEVEKPGSYPFLAERKIIDYIGVAGGFKGKVSLKRAKIIREGKTIKIDLKKVTKGKETDIVLQPGDTIFIPKSNRLGWRDFVDVIFTIGTLRTLIQSFTK